MVPVLSSSLPLLSVRCTYKKCCGFCPSSKTPTCFSICVKNHYKPYHLASVASKDHENVTHDIAGNM